MMIALNSTTFTGSGWQLIGVLPQELKPSIAIRFAGFDNTASSYADASVVSLQLASSGNLSVYFFGDKLTMQPIATITYITK